MAAVCHGQDIIVTNAGWLTMDMVPGLGLTNTVGDTNQDLDVQENIQPMTPPTPPVIAEFITPEIQALADGMQDNPLTIYNYVHDHIRYVAYFGSKKGAQLTLLEKSGNDFDQCALLVALLRAASYTNAGYQFGWMLLPYDNPDGSDRDIHHWLALSVTNSNWSTTTGFLDYLLGAGMRGWPMTAYNWGNNTYALQRVWVTVTVSGTNYTLDPAFKVTEPIAGISLATAMGGTMSTITNALMSAAGGIDFGGSSSNFYTTNLNEAAVRSALAGYTTNLLNYIQNNCPNYSVEQVLSGQYIVPSTNTTLSQTLLFPTTNLNGTMPVISWINQPTNMMSKFTVTFIGTNYHWFMPQLHGQRLSLTISSTGSAQLWQDDTLLTTRATGGGSGTFNVKLTALHPCYNSRWNTNSNKLIPGSNYFSTTKPYANANASYAILYAFEPDWGWLQERQEQLDAYRKEGLSDTSRQVVTETLNVMGLNWQMQVEYIDRILARQIGVLPMFYHRMGRMSQESGFGYYVDIYMDMSATTSSFSANDDHKARWMGQLSCFASAMEHGLIEQLQATNLLGASTIKILELANTNHEAIYMATSSNWSVIHTKLVAYSAANLTLIGGFVSNGYAVLIPQNEVTRLAGAGSWAGFGLMGANSADVQMLIGDTNGIHYGGYVSDLGATVNPSWTAYTGDSQPLYFDSSPVSVPDFTGADPVNMADGTFQVQATDLSLGQTEPRGLSFSRFYNSSRRNSNLGGISYGWLHNYYINAATVTSAQAGLGGTTPAQMASMLVATATVNGLFNASPPDPKNWMVTALITKWGIDQLTGKAVSVTLGKDTIQFIQQPDGSYTPPANCTMTLSQYKSAYSLRERHGRTFQFNTAGWATNIVDQYSQSLQLAYNSSNWVTSATDWKGRALTFTYSTTGAKHLISVADNASRSIGLGYSSGGDLTSVTDPESKTSTLLYDTNHQIIATSNALGQLVASNIYNSFGRVTTQLTQGDTNKTWRIFWSGWLTVSQDPAGGQQSYFYDDKTRLTGNQDALGNLTQMFYDGQDHVVMTISPLNETNQLFYDGNNNLLYKVDPLGFTNSFLYDSLNNLTAVIDPLGNSNTFGYNSQFSLTSSTNGAGNSITFAYNTDGTVHARQDPGGTTTYGYDSTYNQLNSIAYPGSLGSDSFQYSILGDVTNHTNPRGFPTAYLYNQRRQLTNVIAPTNLTVSLGYDALGNRQSSKDARNNSTTYSWSATRHQTGTVYPSTPQGTPVVTNFYDTRDWLTKTLNPLQQPRYYSNNSVQQLIAVADGLSRTNTFVYDPDGHLTNSTDAASETTSQTFDARGETTTVTDAATNIVGKTYDQSGNLIYLTNRNRHFWQFQYDTANRLTNTISPTGKTTGLVYNNWGLVQSVKDALNQSVLSYDARGRMVTNADNVGTRTYVYDLNNNLGTNSENGQSLTCQYDAYDRIISFTNANGYAIHYGYDGNGNLTSLTYPGNLPVTYAYNSLNQLTSVTDWAGRQTTNMYDLAGELTNTARPNGTVRTNGYDAAGQTTNIVERYSTGAMAIEYIAPHWNNVARMDWEFVAPLPHPYTPPLRTMAYDNDNRLTTFNGTTLTNDNDGNMTYGPGTNNTFGTYTYDARDRLTSAFGLSYGYDPGNNRTVLTNGSTVETFVIDPKTSQVLMRIKPGVTNYYVYGNGLLYEVDVTATTNATLYYHYDSRGSTVALTDTNGNITDRMEYSAEGMMTYRAGTNDTPFLYNGRYGVQTDPNGLLFMRARYYNSYICRFVTADPSGFRGGLNMYAFADGNPISETDPFGLGAAGENASQGSWLDQFKEAWGLGTGIAAEQQGQQVEANLLNGLTLGLANPIAAIMSGQDLVGNSMDEGEAVQQLMQVATVDANLFLALATEGFSAEAEGATGGFIEARAADSAALRFSQTTASPWFSSEGTFAGQTISDVAGQLRAGTLSAADVPVQVVTMDGNTLIVNTRSSLALSQAGIPQSSWNLIDMTGNANVVNSITTRLGNNGLTTAGTSTLRITGSGTRASTYFGAGTIRRP